ncbi:MAG: OPT/YSL family transporter [bacterium]|nr:OPT/YSL family transporter [bacterium]
MQDKTHRELSLRGVIIGSLGCIIITATSIYTALKIGALPWPIIFAAIISLFFLKALGKTSLNEANVTHTIMSAGAMVGGGLAFTIPGIWIAQAGEVSILEMFGVCIAGVVLGLICTAFYHRRFVADSDMNYPIGQAAAETLKAGDTGGKVGAKLFGSMGFAFVYAFVRDWFAKIPAMLFGGVSIPGVAFGIYNSPMLLSVGFLVGMGALISWFVGAILGWFGIVVIGGGIGVWSTEVGISITQTLGMGIMMGCGFAVIVKMVYNGIKRKAKGNEEGSEAPSGSSTASETGATLTTLQRLFASKSAKALVVITILLAAAFICFFLGLGPIASCIVVIIVWATVSMSIMSVGRTGIDPMEIFGLIAVILIALVCDLPKVQLFFIAAIIAVACGLAGDVMNDFHAGKVLGTDPKSQWLGQTIGAIIGAIVSALTMALLVNAYGTGAFGADGSFVAAQANAVSAMISGTYDMKIFAAGAAIGFILYLINAPVMTLGLGFYLPFYMSFTAFLGAIVKLIYDAIRKRRSAEVVEGESNSGIIIASGLLGGESIAGIVVAFLVLFTSL